MKTYLYIEPSGDGIDSTTRQIASRIKQIPVSIRGPLKGISIGSSLEGKTSPLSGLLDDLVMVEVPSGDESNTEVVAKILTDLVSENGPGVLFLGFTHQGMELAPAVGWRLGVPVITSCVDLDWHNERAVLKRPFHGGKLLISMEVNFKKGAVISVQKGSWKEEVDAGAAPGDISLTRISWKNAWKSEKTDMIGIFEEGLEGEDITKADILVSVGRGIGDAENLTMVKELSEKLGGMISCSRPVVDLGWLPANHQVGISGKTVTPVIYLALGISGQTNHVAGMDTAGLIIAVNKDEGAPIFNVAHYGIVEDILGFVPELIGQIDQKKST